MDFGSCTGRFILKDNFIIVYVWYILLVYIVVIKVETKDEPMTSDNQKKLLICIYTTCAK